jgi:hypothetical protein
LETKQEEAPASHLIDALAVYRYKLVSFEQQMDKVWAYCAYTFFVLEEGA